MNQSEPIIRRRGRPAKSEQTIQKPEPIADGAAYRSLDERKKSQDDFKRVYSKKEELDHDLYKLTVASLTRDIGYNKHSPILDTVEHIHYYHSIDSRGVPQEFSTKIAGHFHRITVDAVGIAQCSPPLMELLTRRGGRQHKTYREVPYDKHMHPVEYRGSEKIKPMILNAEWVKVQSQVEAPMNEALSQRIDNVVDNG